MPMDEERLSREVATATQLGRLSNMFATKETVSRLEAKVEMIERSTQLQNITIAEMKVNIFHLTTGINKLNDTINKALWVIMTPILVATLYAAFRFGV